METLVHIEYLAAGFCKVYTNTVILEDQFQASCGQFALDTASELFFGFFVFNAIGDEVVENAVL